MTHGVIILSCPAEKTELESEQTFICYEESLASGKLSNLIKIRTKAVQSVPKTNETRINHNVYIMNLSESVIKMSLTAFLTFFLCLIP